MYQQIYNMGIVFPQRWISTGKYYMAKTQSVDIALSTVTNVGENISQRLAAYQRRAQDSEYRATESKQWFDLTRICKDLGMKLLDTPFNIMC
jgi:hypothetical protein